MATDVGGGGGRRTPQRPAAGGGAYPAQGYNYSYGTRTPFQPETYTRLPGIGPIPTGPPPGGGSSGRSGGSSRGGGGGGGYGGGYGPSAYDAWRIAEEQRKQAELEMRKAALTQQLTGARDQARPMLDQYNNQYQSDISNIFSQNQGLTQGYSNQLAQLMQQMQAGTQGTQAMLQRDLGNQGAGGPEMQAMNAMAATNMQGQQFRQQNADAYNQRLAQMMAAAQADAQTQGAGIRASSQGQLENSYASLLAQIGMIGLQ